MFGPVMKKNAPGLAAGKIRIVGDEGCAVALQSRLDHRVPASLDRERRSFVDLQARPVEPRREVGEGGRHVDGRGGVGRRGDLVRQAEEALLQRVEDPEFDPEAAVGRGGDLLPARRVRRSAHCARHGLAVDERLLQRRPSRSSPTFWGTSTK